MGEAYIMKRVKESILIPNADPIKANHLNSAFLLVIPWNPNFSYSMGPPR